MKREDIALIAHDTIANFPQHLGVPLVLFVDKTRFSRYLNLMHMETHVDRTPCFTMETKGGAVIYFCDEIVASLTAGLTSDEKKVFIEAVTLHELLHIWNHLRADTRDDAVFSEELVAQEMRAQYPRQYTLLRSIIRRPVAKTI